MHRTSFKRNPVKKKKNVQYDILLYSNNDVMVREIEEQYYN